MRETATAHIAGDDGVLVVRIRKAHARSSRDAHENLDAALAETQGRRRPLLVDITQALPLDAETRHLYSGQTLVDGFTALALLVEASPLGSDDGQRLLPRRPPGHSDPPVHRRRPRARSG